MPGAPGNALSASYWSRTCSGMGSASATSAGAASIRSLFNMSRFYDSKWRMSGPVRGAFCLLFMAGACRAQLSSTAYRVLGQANLQFNGVNMVQGLELNDPGGVALDPRNGQTHVYISDTRNSR